MSTIAVNAITDANGGSTTSINGTTPNAYNLVGKNRIINGNFAIAQRGTSATGVLNSTYPALDRWKYFLSGPTVDVSQQSFTLGQTDVTGEPEFYLRNTVSSNSGTSDYAILAQHIEDVRTFAGQTCTLSFWAKSSVSGNKIAIELNQSFGTGGSASSRVVTADSDSVTLSTSWQKFSVTLTLPSISGKTIDPSTNTSYLELYLWLSAGSAYDSRASSIGNQAGNFDITLIQFEAGESATEFEHRPYTTELSLCQRYYFRSASIAGYSTVALGYLNTSTRCNFCFQFPVEMRSPPTSSYSGFRIRYQGGNGTTSSLASTYASKSHAEVGINTSSIPTGYPVGLQVNGNASDFIAFDAEL